jgi:glycosyltransferase involved in cell wall biosynthesis
MDKTRFAPMLMLPELGTFAAEAMAQGVPVHIYRMPAVRVLGVIGLARAAYSLRRFVRKHGIHLIHSYGPRNNFVSAWAVRGTGIPVIWHERNIPVDGESDVTRRCLSMPDAVICNSEAVARRFSMDDKRRKKIRVILNGVDVDRFRPMPVQATLQESLGFKEHPVVGIVTNLSRRRRVEFFVRVAERIHRERPEVRFLIVGGDFDDIQTDERRRNLDALIRQCGLQDCVHVAGFQTEVARYVALCTVCCQVTRKDACSRAVLECMAMAKPVVAMNDGGNPELMENGVDGLLVEPGDEAVFADCVMTLLNNPSRMHALGAAARRRVMAQFDVRRNARETESLYMELIQAKAGVRCI